MAFLGLNVAFADQVAATKFRGLNNQANSVTIGPDEAQDLLNVDVSITGQSFKKRSGYGLYKAFGISKPTHGGYHAFDSTGNDYQLWGTSTSLYGIVADGTPTQLISSATLNSTWDCADTQGFSYCVTSSRDAYIKTNGTTMVWNITPLGTMVESTPDRVVVAGVSGSPNTLFVSQSNTFTNFTVGTNATDAFNEVIASPGSKLTHIRWGCGKLLWWKDQSFGYFDFDDQFTAQVKTVSDVIGTFDNTSAIDPGGRVWFRGQDGHTWMYDCSILTKQSINITPDVQVAGKRTTNLWTQTTQSDFQTGLVSSSPVTYVSTNTLSFTISPGDVIVSSFQAVEISSTQWIAGSANNMTIYPSSVTISTNNAGNITNPDFESAFAGNWTATGNGSFLIQQFASAAGGTCGTINPQSGSFIAKGAMDLTLSVFAFEAIDLNSNVLASINLPQPDDCAWRQSALAPGNNIGKRVKFRFHTASVTPGDEYLTTTDSYIWGGVITFYYATSHNGSNDFQAFDNVQNGSSTITSGSFTSQVYNTGFTSATYSLSNFAWTANTSTPTFNLQTSRTPTGPWRSILTSSGTNAVGDQFVQYTSTISVGAGDNALTSITGATILARSTGTYYSAVHSAPNFTSWSTFGVNAPNNGGTQTFYVRAGTNTFSIGSTTPTWTATTAGGLITASTGTFMQFRDDFAITTATHTPTLNDFTLNWFEGTASDQAYMLYFDNAIWESVAFGVGQSTNNYVFKYDLINDGWTLYNFGVGGMLVQGNALYFGDTSNSNVFNYGNSTSDNGTAINAFWKSKDYVGGDPFLQNQLTNIDTFAKKNQGTTLTATYVMDTSTTTTYSISLTDPLRAIVQSRKLIPSGKLGQVFNIQYGDTSASSSWEILGYRIGFTQLPYRPTSP